LSATSSANTAKDQRDEKPFWERKTLSEMTREEWESLCDGCAKCCLEKLEDDASGEIAYTDVACRLLDVKTCRCSNYAQQQRFVPDCVPLHPGNVGELRWMPSTCAYRLLAFGQPLPGWHPLISGDPETVHRAGQSVQGRCVPEAEAGDLEDHIVSWPE